jgi:Rrf2 family protein
MRLSAQDEYGLRCLSQMVRAEPGSSVRISEIAEREGLSTAQVAKFMRLLREAGLVTSVRGQQGGYRLARRADEIRLSEVVEMTGERLFSAAFCDRHAGCGSRCVHLDDCSIRALWSALDRVVLTFLDGRKLSDLRCSERNLKRRIRNKELDDGSGRRTSRGAR